MSPLNTLIATIALIAFVLIVIAIAVSVTTRMKDFKSELKYLDMEITRSSGGERQYWLERKRRLWLSLLPFVKY